MVLGLDKTDLAVMQDINLNACRYIDDDSRPQIISYHISKGPVLLYRTMQDRLNYQAVSGTKFFRGLPYLLI